MIKVRYYLLLLTFLLLLAAHGRDSRTYLSPIVPPAAFVGLYYTCQFRVLGMDLPAYKFQGLPSNLTGNAMGRVVGIPQSVGSFRVTVSYNSNGQHGQTELVLMVVDKRWD
jgi:hypothetical protein